MLDDLKRAIRACPQSHSFRSIAWRRGAEPVLDDRPPRSAWPSTVRTTCQSFEPRQFGEDVIGARSFVSHHRVVPRSFLLRKRSAAAVALLLSGMEACFLGEDRGVKTDHVASRPRIKSAAWYLEDPAVAAGLYLTVEARRARRGGLAQRATSRQQ